MNTNEQMQMFAVSKLKIKAEVESSITTWIELMNKGLLIPLSCMRQSLSKINTKFLSTSLVQDKIRRISTFSDKPGSS